MTGFVVPFGLVFGDIFSASSVEAQKMNSLFIEFLVVAGFIGVLIAFLVIAGAIKYRSSKRTEEPIQITGNKKLEILWTVIPLILVSYFFVMTVKVMAEINKPVRKDIKPDIVIVAHQWWWDMRYPGYNIITANELHIPVGKKLLARIEAADVIHDWWVPALGRKIDAIPGQPNFTWIEADDVGTFEGACSEFCGAQHAWMRIRVIAETKEKFDKWINNQQRINVLPASDVVKTGAELFQKKTCPDCHAIAGTPANAHIGPDLSHLGSRQTLLSGMEPNTYENLSHWLTNPQKIKRGSMMPDFILSKEEVNDLTAYLESLK